MPKTLLKIDPITGSVTDISSESLKLYQNETPAQTLSLSFIVKGLKLY